MATGHSAIEEKKPFTREEYSIPYPDPHRQWSEEMKASFQTSDIPMERKYYNVAALQDYLHSGDESRDPMQTANNMAQLDDHLRQFCRENYDLETKLTNKDRLLFPVKADRLLRAWQTAFNIPDRPSVRYSPLFSMFCWWQLKRCRVSLLKHRKAKRRAADKSIPEALREGRSRRKKQTTERIRLKPSKTLALANGG